MDRKTVEKYISEQYGVEPDFPWEGDTVSAVFRHIDNGKWFALIMHISKAKLGMETDEPADVMNLKIDDPMLHDMLVHEKGIFPSYHMNKQHWITVLLDGTVEMDQISALIDMSYQATASKRRKT